MADIIKSILPSIIPTGDKYKVTYSCDSGVELMSPVTGKIKEVKNDSVKITPNSGDEGGIFTIEKLEWTTVQPTEGATVTYGNTLSATTKQRTVTLTSSRQDLTVLLSKPTDGGKTQLSTGLGLSKDDATRMATDAVRGTIGITNYASQKALDKLKDIPALKIESNEIKDNVLSEELKRIKSLF
jgi:hypothetical protein